MRSENIFRKWMLVVVLFSSATLLYGGFQVHQEAGRKSEYEDAVRKRANHVNSQICREIDSGEVKELPEDAVNFLRVCAERQ